MKWCKLPTCIPICALVAILFASCHTTSTHQFAAPSANWQTRTGQLAYSGPGLSLIGEVLVRSAQNGEFELTFTKAGGVTLLSLRQDAGFGQVEGPLARGRWSGPVANAPPRLRGWFALRDKIAAAGKTGTVEFKAGEQSFNLRF